MLTLFAALAGAQAAPLGVLPAGTARVSAEARLVTSSTLQQPDGLLAWNRVLQSQATVAGAVGLTDRLQTSVAMPVVVSSVLDASGQTPCSAGPAGEGFCDGFVAAGTARADLRYGILQGQTPLTLGVAAAGDPWNAPRRGQRNAVGSGRMNLEGLVEVGRRVQRGDWGFRGSALAAYGRALSPKVTSLDGSSLLRAPADTLQATAEGQVAPPGRTSFGLGLDWLQRLGGVPLDEQWETQWLGASLDRWNVLAQTRLSLRGRFRVALSSGNSLHLRVARTVLAANGPGDATAVGLGWHKVFSRGGPPR